jgi:arginyl-tRNA synthetase
MKVQLASLVSQALQTLQQQGVLAAELPANIQIERSKDAKNGDFACNIALMLAKPAGLKPRDLAEQILANLPADSAVVKVELAGPGFINFFVSQTSIAGVVKEILAARSGYGQTKQYAGTHLHIEYVSANPTGPLHVGHGRGAAYGASLANMLEAVGYSVHREYYVNDAGRQMDILCTSVWLRYLQLNKVELSFPVNAYKGDYVKDIANDVLEQMQQSLVHPIEAVYANVPADLDAAGHGDKEKHIDGLIANAKTLLGSAYRTVFDLGLNLILDDIRDDLAEFRVTYQNWFSERELVDNGAIDHGLAVLAEKGYSYEQEGAIWFKSSEFGDEKDRVLVRSNGQRTYFANDIAYHLNKLERGNQLVIDVLGADHHGYVPRMRAAMQALAGRADALAVPLIQFVSLFRGEEKMAMSTRSGEFVTLRQLREEVGTDAARFFYVMRKADQAMDFDLELAKSKSNENPVYYIQYAHARVCSVLRQCTEKGIEWNVGEGIEHLSMLDTDEGRVLCKRLARYPEVVSAAALQYEPHQLAHYLRELATDFHAYYNKQQFLVDDANLRAARLNLICAVKQVIANGLALLGVSAPEEM